MNNLKKLRNERGLTQFQLSMVLGVTSDYVSILERGDQTPSFKLANKIANYFNVTIDELNFWSDNEENKLKQK